jgi:release factor glutamine methyltransferase
MQRYLDHLNHALGSIYPPSEIGSFSRLLLGKLGGLSSSQIYSDKDRKFPDETLEKLYSAIDRLAQKEPIQYILGETEFYGLSFKVEAGVLIPRPETEELVDLIVQDARSKAMKKPIRILDIGTGSGCIAVSLAKAVPKAIVSAWEISSEALKIATENSKRNNVLIDFRLLDVLGFEPAADEEAAFDVVVSNPPYVCQSEKAGMEENVLDHEPHVALFVRDEDPLQFYREITELALQILKPGGSLYFEINSRMGQETHSLIKSYPFEEVQLYQDISGKDRIIRAHRYYEQLF